jgi:FtsP/CotA-like multicopper oxidase with cupredoxin domain
MLSRRAILAGGAAALAAPPPLAARAQTSPPPTVLKLERRNIEMNGRSASVFGIRQPAGTFGLVTEVGKRFRVRVENGVDEPSLIHWHGLTPPWRQDGVPGISGPPIPPGGSADYDFPLRFGGTFWMHSHQGLQEQLLMTAPLIIRDQRDRADQQEVVVMLADFSFTPPEQIFAALKNAGSTAGMAASGGAPASMSKPGAQCRAWRRRTAERLPTSTTSNMTPSSPNSAPLPIPRWLKSGRAGLFCCASSTAPR